jgi:DNA-binding NarL/FixJ family response regulator
LILTTFELDEYVFGAPRAGANGFLLKHSSPEALIDGIKLVAAGDSLVAPSVTRRLIEEFVRQPDPAIAQGPRWMFLPNETGKYFPWLGEDCRTERWPLAPTSARQP